MDSAKVSVMLSLFMKRACSVECFRIARLVGNVDGSESEFDRQSKQEFDKLLAIQGDVGDVGEASEVLVIEQLQAKADGEASAGMEGITIPELCTFFEQFDANGDGLQRLLCVCTRYTLHLKVVTFNNDIYIEADTCM